MKSLSELLDWREHSYFEERPDHYFLVSVVYPSVLRVCKLTLFKCTYWFEYSGIHMKAKTVRCVSLSDIAGTPVYYEGHPEVKGTIREWGVKDTPFVYVYWGRIPMKDKQNKPLGFPCALPDNYFLHLQPLVG
jgi:hypothetical protein